MQTMNAISPLMNLLGNRPALQQPTVEDVLRTADSVLLKGEQPPVGTGATPAQMAGIVPSQIAAPADAAAQPVPSRLQRFKTFIYKQPRKNGRIHGSIFQKTTFGVVLGCAAWTASHIVGAIAGAPTIGSTLGLVALNGAGLFAGYMAADVASGLLHHWADNYANPKSDNAFVKKFAKQAQRHHFHPRGLGNYTAAAWASPVSLASWAPLVAVTALGLPSPILSGTLSLVMGTTIYGVFHMWSHKMHDDIPPVGKFLQNIGIAVKPRDHWKHHAMPWNTDYCLVSGLMNKPLNAIHFWPRYEKAVYHVTGKAPESWNVPEYKAYVDGKITRQEYESQLKEIARNFKEHEAPIRKEKWGIDG